MKRHTPALAILALLLASCAGAGGSPLRPVAQASAPAASAAGADPAGYLASADLPDSLAILPPAPVAGSVRQQADEAITADIRRNTPPERVQQAASDADLSWPHLVVGFEQVLGVPIASANAPNLIAVIRRVRIDSSASTRRAKDRYMRVRPFMALQTSTCFPQDDVRLRPSGSYPSGHSAIGWSIAEVLAELVPERQNALLERGYQFGQSRVICLAHWQSDVDAGRAMASATLARLHADPEFRRQLDLARVELRRLLPAPPGS